MRDNVRNKDALRAFLLPFRCYSTHFSVHPRFVTSSSVCLPATGKVALVRGRVPFADGKLCGAVAQVQRSLHRFFSACSLQCNSHLAIDIILTHVRKDALKRTFFLLSILQQLYNLLGIMV
tara:strand:- start:212 stop:574 length:363 start_codon:yes stop_codon:yes gene_type:complete